MLIQPGNEYITLNAHFEPIDTKLLNQGTFYYLNSQKNLAGLEAWKKPNKPQLNLPVKIFGSFLPKNLDNIKIGDVWDVVPIKTDLVDEFVPNSRYEPLELALSESEKVIFKILQMFHSNAFIYTRFAPQGAAMYLRAFNDDYLDILFRIHAEYQLNEPPLFPFWFTPGSFNGRLVIARNATNIKMFNLFVPNKNRLNVDMEWLNSDINEGNMEVDIGYIPRMEIILSEKSSVLSDGFLTDFKPELVGHEVSIENITWTEEVSIQRGYDELEKTFYPFKKVKYHSFLEAFKEAAKASKLVHFIMLWGALDVRIKFQSFKVFKLFFSKKILSGSVMLRFGPDFKRNCSSKFGRS